MTINTNVGRHEFSEARQQTLSRQDNILVAAGQYAYMDSSYCTRRNF